MAFVVSMLFIGIGCKEESAPVVEEAIDGNKLIQIEEEECQCERDDCQRDDCKCT